MLELLRIRNLAVIDESEIPFGKGLNVLSGETGAGKSIVLEAIALLLGSRASADLVRTGTDEAIVEGVFDLKNMPEVKERAERLGFPLEGNELILKRIVSRSGKHRIFIGGGIATLGALQEISDGLVDLCSQHEHQSLLKPAFQMELLDRYAGKLTESAKLRAGFLKWKDLQEERARIAGSTEERARRAAYLRYQLEELSAKRPEEGEEDRLQSEKTMLQSSENRALLSERARSAIEEEGGTLSSLREAVAAMKELARLDSGEAESFSSRAEVLLSSLEDLSLEVSRYAGKVDLDPEKLPLIRDRLSELADLRRKYGAEVVSAPDAVLSGIETELRDIEGADARLEEIEQSLQKISRDLEAAGAKLHQFREKAAKDISKAATEELQELRMEGASVRFVLRGPLPISEWTDAGLSGEAKILARTNAGEEEKSLGKVASGGEISRIMLAMRRVVSDRGGIGVYLFDEIDSGIGGKTAFVVGRKLQSVAKHHQVLCITHVPQVAAFADHHLSVEKAVKSGRTQTRILTLGKIERKEEIARMLGGPKLTKSSLENAGELLGQASKRS